MTTPIERLSGLVIGTVESVAPDKITVLLELDAPHNVALNTGTPAAFPRINGYVLIPNESGATVGFIAWIGIERSPYPKRTGYKDFGLIDLPFPLRKMSVSPVGTLTTQQTGPLAQPKYALSRGVVAFPSVGDQVLLPTTEQTAAIVGARDSDKRVRIGTSPLAGHAAIKVDPDKIFGRHLAVLGNTGSGKSCSVAGLIRWSLDAARENLATSGHTETAPNARFIVLDPNGEYAKAFQDHGGQCRVFRVPPVSGGVKPLQVPAWMWNGHEWSAISHAAPGTQRPLLIQALRNLRAGRPARESIHIIIARQVYLYRKKIKNIIEDGTGNLYSGYSGRNDCGDTLDNMNRLFSSLSDRMKHTDACHALLIEIASASERLVANHRTPK